MQSYIYPNVVIYIINDSIKIQNAKGRMNKENSKLQKEAECKHKCLSRFQPRTNSSI